ncbi:MAG: phasin family protein [Pseudomonadota bacterium]|nr:phasin family protein [Pseudomonadota bacterium]
MVSRPRKHTPAPPASAIPTPPAMSGPAHNIWLAGLGAFASAQAEGSKAFEALVKQGLALQSQTQALAKERLTEAAERMEELTAQAGAAARWDKLEGIFEQRVARALTRVGSPTAQDWAALLARVEALEQQLATRPAASPTRKAAKKAG